MGGEGHSILPATWWTQLSSSDHRRRSLRLPSLSLSARSSSPIRASASGDRIGRTSAPPLQVRARACVPLFDSSSRRLVSLFLVRVLSGFAALSRGVVGDGGGRLCRHGVGSRGCEWRRDVCVSPRPCFRIKLETSRFFIGFFFLSFGFGEFECCRRRSDCEQCRSGYSDG